ncbi:MAG: glycosyl hydrolase 53 family protein [Chitinispirillaceae bacterium]|nr:glycosyl hydrolase 53 family protein [Chitinispirillaceae bacterium]
MNAPGKFLLVIGGLLLAVSLPCGRDAIVTTTPRTVPFILGADISWIPEREAAGIRYSDNGEQKDLFTILKDHRFNYIRLRIFHNPAAPNGGSVETTGAVYSGYSPQGYCGLAPTKAMALRIKTAGMKFLLDFHYSDNWADPGKQYKPHAWANASFSQLTDSVRNHTRHVLTELKNQGTLPDMVQVGNEIVGGMIWPDGRNSNMAQFAALVNAGIDGVREVDTSVLICIHSIAERSPSGWLSSLIRAGVTRINVFGLSYYSEWHGTPDTLSRLLNEVARNHPSMGIAVAEYADNHRRVNDIVFGLPGNRGIGTFVWEPTDWRETLFDRQGSVRVTNARIDLYPQMSRDYGNDDIVKITPMPSGFCAPSMVLLNNQGVLRFATSVPGPVKIALYSLSGRLAWSCGMNVETGEHEVRIGTPMLLKAKEFRIISIAQPNRPAYSGIVPVLGE